MLFRKRMKKIFRRTQAGRLIGYYSVRLAAVTYAALELFNRRKNQTKKPMPVIRNIPKVGRNEPCLCRSGLKYKRCHGKGT